MSTIESVLHETRVFPPSAEFVGQANISGMAAYQALCAEAERDYAGYWARLARGELIWKKPFTQALDESKAPFYRWFAPHLDKGIMIGVFLSLAVFLYKGMRPTIVSLSKADDDALRDAGFHGLKQCEYIAVVRFDGPLFFGNASYLENRVSEIRSDKPKLKRILLVCNGISDMDASGEESLSLLVDRTRSAGIDFSLSGVNRSVMAVMKRTHLLAKIGKDHVYPTTNMAIYAIHDQTHSGEEEDACPLITVCRVA